MLRWNCLGNILNGPHRESRAPGRFLRFVSTPVMRHKISSVAARTQLPCETVSCKEEYKKIIGTDLTAIAGPLLQRLQNASERGRFVLKQEDPLCFESESVDE